jgi:hypothetical protein
VFVLQQWQRRWGGSSKEAERGIEVQNIVQSTRKTFGVPSQGVLIESSDKIVRLSEARYACETRLRELEQQFEVKAAKVREEYLAAVLEIHAPEANGSQHAHVTSFASGISSSRAVLAGGAAHGACRAACEAGMSAAPDLLGFHCGPMFAAGLPIRREAEVAPNFSR